MALLKAISFDYISAAEDPGLALVQGSFQTSQVRTGIRSYSCAFFSSEFYRRVELVLAAAESELYFQCCPYNYDNGRRHVRWMNGATVLGGIKSNGNYLEVYSGDFATLLGTTGIPVPTSQYSVIEVYLKIGDEDGAVAIRIDGGLALNLTGVNSKPGADTHIDRIHFGSLSYLDDIIINNTSGSHNNSWPCGAKVEVLPVTSDGATLQWTPTPSGDHYACVDETTPSATDNLVATDTNLLDEFGFTNLGEGITDIVAVIVEATAFKGSINPPTTLKLGLKVSGSDYLSSDLAAPGSAAVVKHVFDLNPSSGQAWDKAAVDAAVALLKSGST